MNITMKKKLIVTSLLAASVFASAANAADGTFNIAGSIASTPCVATADKADVKMPLINKENLGDSTGKFSDLSATDLTIKLTGCPNVAQTATVTFNGTADKNEIKALELGGVKGVALAVFEANGTDQIAINQAAKGQALTGSATKDLNYKVKYVTTSDTFQEGNAIATLNFDVAYN
ncbi:TPA: type 1 fimbrial protein [Yersinia enterocolitica]|nr:type 1 fimbrial protein [Yersinia enterocolitica]